MAPTISWDQFVTSKSKHRRNLSLGDKWYLLHEEAVEDNDSSGNSPSSSRVVPSGSKKSNLDNTASAPPSYEESHDKAKKAS